MSSTPLLALVARCRVLCRPRSHAADAELLERFAQQRDAVAFEELLERYAPLVWGVCRRLVPAEADCEDAFQATFLALVRRAGSLDGARPLGGWLHTVAVRVARKAAARSRRQCPQATLPERATSGDVADNVSSRQLFRAVDEEIERLPSRLRVPILLCCLQGRTRDEAAEALGCSVAAVKGRLERGRDLLRRRLVRRGVQLPAAFLTLGLTSERLRAGLWAKTMQSALYTPAPAVAALAQAGLPALALGISKLTLAAVAALMMATATAGVISQVRTAPSPQPPAATTPRAKAAAEPNKPETPRIRTDRHGDPLPDGAVARLGTVRWRHGFAVSALANSPDGKKIAAVGAGRAITLWDSATGKAIHQFPNRGQPIGVVFSPDGNTLATAGRGNLVSLWDVDTAKLVRQLKHPQHGSSALAFSPHGKILAAADSDGTIYFWDAATGAEQRRIDGRQGYLSALAFSPDGKVLASAGLDGMIRLWDPRTGREERRFKGHTKEAWKVVFSPDGKLLASSGWDDPLRLWDSATGRQVRLLREKQEKPGRAGPIAFLPDGKLLAEGRSDGTIRLWEVASGSVQRRWQAASTRVFTLAISPDGKTLASGAIFESDVHLWDVATGREKHSSNEHRGPIRFLRFSSDGAALISIGQDRRILRWDLATNTPRQQFSWTSQGIDTFAQSPDGNTLVRAALPDSEVRLWDLRTGKPGRLLGKQEHEWRMPSVAFSPDGRLVASGGEDHVIHVWNVSNSKEVRQIKGFKTYVEWLCFSPDSKALACGMSTAGKRTGEATLRLWDLASGKERCSFDCHVFTEGPLAFSPDGKKLASGHGSPGDPPRQGSMVRLWDATTGKELVGHTGPGDETCSVAFSPDGKLIASGYGGTGAADNSVHVWEATTGRLIRCFEGHHSGVSSVTFSPDGLTVASGAGDSTILLWDITGCRADGRWHSKPLTPRQLESCWTALTNVDAAKAYAAVWAFVAAPEQAVPFLRKHLTPVPHPDAKTVARLIADLDSSDFKVRQKATEELSKLGDAAAPALRQAVEDKPSLEMRRRLQQLLDQSRDWTAERLRDHRAIQALEHIGTRQAKKVLQALAGGAAETQRTEEAKAALQRLTC